MLRMTYWDFHRRGVDAQNVAVLVEQDESLAHTAGDLREFVGLFAQLAQLCPDLDVLVVDALEQRRELLIGVVFQRMLEVERVERLDDALGQTTREQTREHEQHDHDEQNGKTD